MTAGHRLHRSLCLVAATLALASASTLTGVASTRSSAGRAATVSYAIRPGERPIYIFPLVSGADFTYANVTGFQYLIDRPLYWFGAGAKAQINYSLSLADAPVFSNHDKTVTIDLKHYSWSDGVPITARDVQFWMDLLIADKADWGDYVPSQFPDNVVSLRVQSRTQFSITFNHTYNPTWLLYNELSQITPIPQHSWDRTSAAGPVGSYDRRPAGAAKVYQFLNHQSMDLTTYSTNPLWQVVDGPWRIAPRDGFSPATGYTVLVPNRRYSGPVKPQIGRLELVPFTSDSAEFASLRSGRIDYGYLPLSDISQRRYLMSHGYRITPWNVYAFSFIAINFRNPALGPVFKQLYVRQALQHLVDQPSWIRNILHGFGTPSYSPVPITVPSPFADGYVRRNHYPFSVAAAARILAAHGWAIHPNGADVCARAGRARDECGAGVARGASLRIALQYSAGDLALQQEMEAYQSAAAGAGVDLTVLSRPADTLLSEGYSPCAAAGGPGCSWQMLDFHATDANAYFPDYYPTGGIYYATGAAYGVGGYSNSAADRLIRATHVRSGLAAFRAYENYIADQLPNLWVPNGPIQISVVKSSLRGTNPQDPYTSMYPENWRLAG
ncbi:MAG TPA: ABC transporter substrate-binding protein [Candidatus Micrarchaeia archaeon]|nr:ABC transporter substrate-binding protein [Candidatus Micrarchaeia archaeon]